MSGRGSSGTASTRWSVPGDDRPGAAGAGRDRGHLRRATVGYSTFLAYDEVAHHSGVERSDSAVRAAQGRSPDRADRRGGPRRGRTACRSCRSRAVGGDVPRPLRDLASRSWSSAPAMPRTSEPNTRDEQALSYLNASLTEPGRPTPHVGGPSAVGEAPPRGRGGTLGDGQRSGLGRRAAGAVGDGLRCLDWSISRASRAA